MFTEDYLMRIINQARYRSNGSGYEDPSRIAHIWTIDIADSAKPKQLTTGDFAQAIMSPLAHHRVSRLVQTAFVFLTICQHGRGVRFLAHSYALPFTSYLPGAHLIRATRHLSER